MPIAVVPPPRPPIPSYLGRREWFVFAGIALVAYLCLPRIPDLIDGLVESQEVALARSLLAQAPEPRTPDGRARRARQRCQMALAEGDVPAALAFARAAVDAWPGGLGHRVRLADLEEAFCAPERTREALEGAREEYHRWIAAGRPDLLALARDVVPLAPGELPTLDTLSARIDEWFLDQLRRLGALERVQLRPEPALSIARELVHARPGVRDLQVVLAALEGQAGNTAAAREALAAASHAEGGARDLSELLSYRLEWAGQSEAALTALAAAGLDSEHNRERALDLLLRTRDPYDALTEYRRRYPADGDRRAQYLVTTRLLSDRGDRAAARRVARVAFAELPRSLDVLEMVADLESQDDPALAFRAANALAEAEPERLDRVARALDAAEAAHLPAEAERLLTRLTELDAAATPDPERDRDLGVRLAQMGRLALAQPHLERAARAYPDDRMVLFHLARTKSAAGDSAAAIELLRRVQAPEATAPAPAPSSPPPPTGERPVPRRVLALFKRAAGAATDLNLTHQNLEVVLDHLGLVVDHRAADDPLPTDAEMEAYRGVVTWYRTELMPHADDYARWVARQARAGRRFAIFDRLGCSVDANTGRPVEPRLFADMQAALGLAIGSQWTDEAASVRIANVDPAMCEFERPLGSEASYFLDLAATGPGQTVYLKLARADAPSRTCDAVFTGPHGGFVLDGYSVYDEPEGTAHRWRLDPYRFLTRALALGGEPRPDPTTVDGARAVYQHVDGDGSTQFLIDRPEVSCTASMLADVVARWPYLYTMSFIGRLVDPAAGAGARDREDARRLLAHPRVEAGHHSYTHPMDWRAPGAKIDRRLEIVQARAAVEALCPPGKSAALCQWPGQANPDRAALAIAWADGQLNINGGGALRDPNHDSQLYLTPFARVVEDELQLLTSARDDFGITENGSLPAVAYSDVIHTYESTASPRLLPVNVYFHFYTLATPGARRGLELIEEWLERQRLHPVFTTDWLRGVLGFRAARVRDLGGDVWEVRDHGACRTMRFDGRPAGSGVDLARSQGVTGWLEDADALYVHLASDAPARIAMSAAPPVHPHLASSTTAVRDVRLTAGIALTADAATPVSVRLAGFAPAARLAVRVDGSLEVRNADERGELEVPHAAASAPLHVEVSAAP